MKMLNNFLKKFNNPVPVFAQTKMEKETQNEDKDDSEEETTSNEKKGTCAICGKQDSLDNLEHLHGIGYTVHISCLESYPTCQNCGNSLFEFESDTPGICFSCGN